MIAWIAKRQLSRLVFGLTPLLAFAVGFTGKFTVGEHASSAAQWAAVGVPMGAVFVAGLVVAMRADVIENPPPAPHVARHRAAR